LLPALADLASAAAAAVAEGATVTITPAVGGLDSWHVHDLGVDLHH